MSTPDNKESNEVSKSPADKEKFEALVERYSDNTLARVAMEAVCAVPLGQLIPDNCKAVAVADVRASSKGRL